MLRAKQITSLSSCARSFLYSGSLYGKPEGSSCANPDEENHTSTRQSKNDPAPYSKASLIAPKNERSVNPVKLVSAVKASTSQQVDNVQRSTPIAQAAKSAASKVASSAADAAGSNCVRYSEGVDDDPKVPAVGDRLMQAGIATVGIISDLMTYKLPIDRNGTGVQGQCYMIDPSGTRSTVQPSLVKPVKKDAVYATKKKLSPEAEVVSNPSGAYRNGPRVKHENHDSGRGGRRDKSTVHVGKVAEAESKILDKKIYVPKRSKDGRRNTPQSNSGFDISQPRYSGSVAQKFNKHQMDSKSKARYSNTSNVVGCVLDILTRHKWGPAAESALANLGFSLDAYLANQVLKQIHDHNVALGFFNWLKRQPGFKHDGHTYTTMVGVLGGARKFGEINDLLEQMVRDGCKPNVVTYNRLIHSYGRANYLSQAVEVFHQMQKAGCQPDRVTYCTLIDIHAKAGFLDVAMHMYQRMQQAGLSPDTFTYSVIINCLGKGGHLADAHRLFCEMVDQGCVPNLVTYNIMIALQAKARNYSVALDIYRDMQKAGYAPDNVTYNIVMEVLGHCGCLEEAEVVFTEMSKKWVPDEPVYGLMVDMWGKAGNVDKALGWYQAMLNAGLFPNVPTCNSLLSTFLRAHRFGDAYKLLASMVQMGLNPSLQTYTLLLSCSTEAKSAMDMGFCGQLMSITGHPVHSFLLTMPASGPDGRNVRVHVARFLDMMHSEDRESKRGLVDAVVDFLHKSGLKEEAGSVWEVASEKNVYPEAVKEKGRSYWLINLHVMSDGTAVTALSRTLAGLRRRMLASGEGPSRIDIVTGWGRRSRVTGTSLVRQAVQELLDVFSFPFSAEGGNHGCFVGCGEPLSRWLRQPCVERMHLL